jgi:hypothetical protein
MPDNLESFGIFAGRNGSALDDRSIDTGADNVRNRGRMAAWHNKKESLS